MKLKRRVDELREQALTLLREDQALAFVISPPDPAGKERAELTRARILQGSKKEVLSYIAGVRQHMQGRRREYGVRAKPRDLLSFLEHAEQAPPGQLMWAPLFFVRSFFRDYAKVWPGSALLPAHARVMFDAQGLGATGEPIHGIRLVEGTVYEDMAALCNLAIGQSESAQGATVRLPTKTLDALCRATIAASVYFVEAYLNGLAFDHLVQHEDSLSPDERLILQDWDEKRNRPRYLSLRDKLLQYQRIVTRSQHARLQESNCPEIARFLEIVDLIRNPLAHPSPHFDLDTGRPDKELALYSVTLETACDAADCAVSLVKKLEEVVCGHNDRIPWLFSRGSDGRFPPEAFE